MVVAIERIDAVTGEVATALGVLIPQLSDSAAVDVEFLRRVVASEATSVFAARLDGCIVGLASLVVYPLPTGLRGHVDDVVVDGAARGHGCARALLLRVIAEAETRGVRSLELAPRPSRRAAIALYASVGFVRRETGVYRYAG